MILGDHWQFQNITSVISCSESDDELKFPVKLLRSCNRDRRIVDSEVTALPLAVVARFPMR